MSSSEKVRPARASDLDTLGTLGVQLVAEHYHFDPKRFLAPTAATPEAYARFLGSQLERPDAVLLVAARGDAVLGYAYGEVQGNDYKALRGPAGVLHDLVVDPAHRGQGVGRMLLDAALAALAELGAPRVVLFTADRNSAAQRLFAQAGFRRTMIEMTRELD
jgi:ribosomal protein S18 acetylase RimI-like enzyme